MPTFKPGHFFTHVMSNKFLYSLNILTLLSGIYVMILLGNSIIKENTYDRFHENVNNIYKLNVTVTVNSERLKIGLVPTFDAAELKNTFSSIKKVVRFNVQNTNSLFQNKQKTIIEAYTIKANNDFFNLFSFDLTQGNKRTALKDVHAAVLTQSLKQKLFNDSDCIGQPVLINGTNYIITGVCKDIPSNSTIQFEAALSYSPEDEYRDDWNYAFIEIKDKTNVQNLQENITRWFKESLSGNYDEDALDLNFSLTKLSSVHLSETNIYDLGKANSKIIYLRKVLLLVLLFFIVFIYAINLILITQKRMKEYAVRHIFGASKMKLIFNLIFESILHILIIGSFTIGLIYLMPNVNPFSQSFSILWSTGLIAFIVVVTVILSIIPVIYPSYLIARLNPQTSLARRFQGVTKVQSFVTLFVQVFITLLILDISKGISRQIQMLTNKDLGFNDNAVLILEKLNRDSPMSNVHGFLNSLKGLAGVVSLTTVRYGSLPGVHLNVDKNLAILNDEKAKVNDQLEVGNNFIGTLDIHLVTGKDLNFNETKNEVLVNQAFVKQFHLNNPINQKVNNATIVGVVKNFNYTSLHNKIMPLVIHKDSKAFDVVIIRINSNVSTSELMKSINKLSGTSLDGIVWDQYLLKDKINISYSEDISMETMMTYYFYLIAFLAVMGLFGVSIYEFNRKQLEMSIRKIYGAGGNDLLYRLLKTPIILFVICWGLSIPLSQFILNQWLVNFEYRIDVSLGMLVINGLIALFVVLAIFMLSFYSNEIKLSKWIINNRNIE